MADILNPAFSPRSIWTLSELRDRVRGKLGLRNAAFLTDDDVSDYLNEAQVEIARTWKWFRQTLTTGTIAGQAEYNLPQPAAARCLSIEEIYHNSLPLAFARPETVAAWEWNWRFQSGLPWAWLVRGDHAYRLYPTPDATAGTAILLVYASLPPEVTATEDKFYVPHGWDTALIHYGCWQGSIKDAHGEGARRVDLFERLWLRDLKAIGDDVHDAAEPHVAAFGADNLRASTTRPGVYVPYFTNIGPPV